MAEKLCPSREVSWVVSKKGISMNNFEVEKSIYLDNICSRVSPCTYMTIVPDMRT